jgi:hypothetical protein
MSMPPPRGSEPAAPADAAPAPPVVLELDAPTGGLKRLVGRRSAGRLSVSPAQIVIEEPTRLRAPLELAPGGIAVATLDPGPARVEEGVGRFPILHRLSATAIVPREEGIDGWLWTSTDGSAYTLLADDDLAPNVALVFLKPLEADVVSEVFEPEFLDELAERSPMGSPTVFGVLLRVARPEDARTALDRLHLVRPLTDREVPPTQRRHLPTDKPANPTLRPGEEAHARTSVPPPGMS